MRATVIILPAIVGPSPLRNTKRSSAPGARSPSMSVGNQAARCSGSVSARHTFSGGVSKLARESQPPPAIDLFKLSLHVRVPFCLSLVGIGHGVEVPFE